MPKRIYFKHAVKPSEKIKLSMHAERACRLINNEYNEIMSVLYQNPQKVRDYGLNLHASLLSAWEQVPRFPHFSHPST